VKISRVNWGEVGEARPSWSPVSGRLCAIWPSPVDHDQCFAAAGFTDFADSDGTWWLHFGDLVARIVGVLEPAGHAVVRTGETPSGVEGRQVVPQALLAAATDDNFPTCLVEFGDPPRASIRTSNGHAIMWLWTADGTAIDAVLSAMALGHEVRQLSLRWDKLA
jgi:hypothetical protein